MNGLECSKWSAETQFDFHFRESAPPLASQPGTPLHQVVGQRPSAPAPTCTFEACPMDQGMREHSPKPEHLVCRKHLCSSPVLSIHLIEKIEKKKNWAPSGVAQWIGPVN